MHGALNASAINVVDLEAQPLPVARFETARSEYSGGIALRTTPGDPQSIDIIFLDERGADLSQAAQRKLERVFSRQEYRRAFPGEIAELTYPPRVIEAYTRELLRCVDMNGVRGAGLRVVADCAGGTASLVLPGLLGRIGVDVLTVNNRLDEASPTQSLAQIRADMHRLAELVSSSRAAFGVRFDPVGERITLVDEKGAMVSDDRALLVVLDLISAERRAGRVALPVTTTRVAEEVSRYHGVQVDWTPTSLYGLYEAAAADDMIFAADGRGGFVVPEFSRSIDGIAAFARLIGLVARTRLTLSQIHARIPTAYLLKRSIPTPWAAKGAVMRTVIEAAGDKTVDTTDGVRVVEEGKGWILVLPDPSDSVTHLWAEGTDGDQAQALLDEWAAVVEQAGRLSKAAGPGQPWPREPRPGMRESPFVVGTVSDSRSSEVLPACGGGVVPGPGRDPGAPRQRVPRQRAPRQCPGRGPRRSSGPEGRGRGVRGAWTGPRRRRYRCPHHRNPPHRTPRRTGPAAASGLTCWPFPSRSRRLGG